MKIIHSSIGQGLRTARLARGLSQEDFVSVTGRTHMSDLERGVKSPSISKIDQLAAVMKLHPLSVLTLSYSKTPTSRDVAALLARVTAELDELMAGTAGG